MDKVIAWLLEDDNPAVKYRTLKNILGKKFSPEEKTDLESRIRNYYPVKSILEFQNDKSWQYSGHHSVYPMYKSSFWQVYFLSVLGATRKFPEINGPVEMIVKNMQSEKGSFPSIEKYRGNLMCMHGIILEMFLLLGYGREIFNLNLLNFLTDYIYKNDFRCKYRQNLKCPWGAIKILKAMNLLEEDLKSPEVISVTEKAKKFLISHDITEANYPRKKPRSNQWFLFGFPRGFRCDILELTGTLVDSGCRKQNSNIKRALKYIMGKKNTDGMWKMEHSLNGKMLVDIEKKNKPSKWVTYLALKTLKNSNYISI